MPYGRNRSGSSCASLLVRHRQSLWSHSLWTLPCHPPQRMCLTVVTVGSGHSWSYIGFQKSQRSSPRPGSFRSPRSDSNTSPPPWSEPKVWLSAAASRSPWTCAGLGPRISCRRCGLCRAPRLSRQRGSSESSKPRTKRRMRTSRGMTCASLHIAWRSKPPARTLSRTSTAQCWSSAKKPGGTSAGPISVNRQAVRMQLLPKQWIT
mmetsp:Transcript_16195/g.38259  ORF Transcript_16195/g.38259 Transcript_16195/m.38259 type:complete len:206 (-) Transcript_16195:686-1303(-)